MVPSLYARKLSEALRYILSKEEVHDLWLVGCFLHPYFRVISFWNNEEERCTFRIRAEAMTRMLYRAYSESGAEQGTTLAEAAEIGAQGSTSIGTKS